MAKQLSELDELFIRRLEWWQKLIRVSDVVRGSVVVLRRPCTRKTCRRCASGERHPATYLGYRAGGKLHWLYLPKDLIPRAKEWVRNYRELERILAELSETNVKILRVRSREASRKKAADRTGGHKR